MERFWSKVDSSAGPDACWPWTAKRDRDGYGRFWFRGRNVQATHVLLMLEGRPLAPGNIACHSCDNPTCCNPAHVRSGTHQTNAREREARERGRQQRGERCGAAKLCESDVRDILAALESGESRARLAARFNVTTVTIGMIGRRKTWKHVQ